MYINNGYNQHFFFISPAAGTRVQLSFWAVVLAAIFALVLTKVIA